ENRELRREGRVVPLQEKPFKLLEALLAHPGQIVTREELYGILWPDAEHLDFEANLNVAARKLRQALEDSTEEPKWLETAPRRGYRLKAQVRPKATPTAPLEASPPPQRRGDWAAVGFAVVGLLALVWLLAARMEQASSSPVRLAIMPFELAASGEPMRPDLAPISEWLVAEMAKTRRVEVVGPRTTARYEAKPFPELFRLASDLDIDYVLNARVVDEEEAPAILVELIRLSDGAHPWVNYFERIDDWREVAETIRRGVSDVL
ncbi:MAG: winged helix-turn-helix domain-containing protein, partial [Acidobacteriota bacterium]